MNNELAANLKALRAAVTQLEALAELPEDAPARAPLTKAVAENMARYLESVTRNLGVEAF